MKYLAALLTAAVLLLSAAAGFGQEDSFDSEKMIEELEKKLEISKDKLQELKPAIDAKSEELKKLMQESLDRGYLQLEEMNRTIEELSAESEKKMQSILNSEQVAKLKDYLSKVDKDAIQDARKKLVEEITELLELTEEQLVEIKPLLEDSVARLSEMIAGLKAEGGKNWEEFKKQYEQISRDLKEKLEETLNRQQIEKLEKYQEEKRERIHQALFV